jgi:hypothetical protein
MLDRPHLVLAQRVLDLARRTGGGQTTDQATDQATDQVTDQVTDPAGDPAGDEDDR